MIGVSASGRIPVTTTYMNEVVPEKYKVVVTTALLVTDGFIMVFQVCYYYFNRNSYPLYWFLVGAMTLLTLMTLVLPESPKYFYARNRFDDARKSL